MMIRPVSLLLATGFLISASATAMAQWATPVAVSLPVRDMQVLPERWPEQGKREHPRTGVVAPIAAVFGVAGGVAGYLAAEQSCTRTTYECWDHFIYVPTGYVLGVALGGGIAGTAERCRSGILRSSAGALLGFVVGVAASSVVQEAGIVILPVAPVVGATWLVARCRATVPAGSSHPDA